MKKDILPNKDKREGEPVKIDLKKRVKVDPDKSSKDVKRYG